MDDFKSEDRPLKDPSESEQDEYQRSMPQAVDVDDNPQESSSRTNKRKCCVRAALLTVTVLAMIGLGVAIHFEVNKDSKDTSTDLLSTDSNLTDAATSDLPGINYMNKLYNMMNGKAVPDQNAMDIIVYQFNDHKVASDSGKDYSIPDEFGNTPIISPDCMISSKTNSVYQSISTNVLSEQSSTVSQGYSQTTELKADLPLGDSGISESASTTMTNALMFGQTSTSVSAQSHYESSYSWSFSLQNMVSWYEAQIPWDLDTSHFQFTVSYMFLICFSSNHETMHFLTNTK